MRNYSLDFFRGIAAVLVCIGHLYFWNNNFTTISSAFILAVDFFLVLSGFVISQSILTKKDFSIPKFIANRWFRLFPVFFLCFVLIGIPKLFFSHDYVLPNFYDLIKYLIIGHMLPINLDSQFKDPLSIAYTISAELWVGAIIFPIIYFTNKIFKFLILILIIFYSYINIILYSPNFMDIHYDFFNDYIYFGALRCFLDYSIGIITYLISTNLNKIKLKESIISILQVSTILLIFLIYTPINYDRNLEFVAPLFFSILILLISTKKGLVYKSTNKNFSIFLGGISYPIYLIHPLLVGFYSLLKIPLNTINTSIYLIICIIISWVIHSKYEKPMMKYLLK